MKKYFINPEIGIVLFDRESISTTDASAVPLTNQQMAVDWVKGRACKVVGANNSQTAISIIQFSE